MLDLTKTAFIKDAQCDLETAVAWAIRAKNSLMKNNGLSQNKLLFGKNPNYHP